jgi:hypothetical protein
VPVLCLGFRGSSSRLSSAAPTLSTVGSTATTTVISSSSPSTTPFKTPLYRSKYLSSRQLEADEDSHDDSRNGEMPACLMLTKAITLLSVFRVSCGLHCISFCNPSLLPVAEKEDPSQKSSAIRARRKRDNRRPTGKVNLEDLPVSLSCLHSIIAMQIYSLCNFHLQSSESESTTTTLTKKTDAKNDDVKVSVSASAQCSSLDTFKNGFLFRTPCRLKLHLVCILFFQIKLFYIQKLNTIHITHPLDCIMKKFFFFKIVVQNPKLFFIE